MPDTRPGIIFNEEGVCSACVHYENRRNIDWEKRYSELEALCDKYRRDDGYYDCIVTVSGGKDSHYQIYVMKELMGMNPLLVNVYNFDWTDTGRHNFNNMTESFGCDMVSLHLNRKLAKKMIRIAFEEWGSPTWYWDRAVYVWPIKTAIRYDVPLIVYGENVSYEYGGFQNEETYSAREQVNNDVAKNIDIEFWESKGIERRDLNPIIYPSAEEIDEAGLEPMYLSYFIPWIETRNLAIAKKYGFKTLGNEWDREGFIDDWIQIDAVSYLVHPWLKYPKYGHTVATDVASKLIREGEISRKEGIKLVKNHDHCLDQKSVEAFLDFTGYTAKGFWTIVDKFYNRDLFKKKNGRWVLKDPVWEKES